MGKCKVLLLLSKHGVKTEIEREGARGSHGRNEGQDFTRRVRFARHRVMIGAGIFALVGQVAGFAGDWFPLAFLLGAIVAGVSAYSYTRYSSVNPLRVVLRCY